MDDWCAKKEKDVSSSEKFLIVAVIGHRLEPKSQALSRFKRPLENQFQEVVIHFERYPLLLLLWNFSTLSRHLFPVRYQNTVSKKLQMFQSVGPEQHGTVQQ